MQEVPRLGFRVLNFRKLNTHGFCKIFWLPHSNVARAILGHVTVIRLKHLYIKNFWSTSHKLALDSLLLVLQWDYK